MSMTPNSLSRVSRALAFAAAALLLTAPAVAQQQKSKRPRVDVIVEKALQEGRDLPVIVRYKDEAAAERVKQNAGRRHSGGQIKALRALAIDADHRALRELHDDESGDIEAVSYDAPVSGSQFDLLKGLTLTSGDGPAATLSQDAVLSTQSVGGNLAATRYGVTGAGVNVAVIDSGVRPHPDLPATRIAKFIDFVNGRSQPYDDYGHGTHVAGIIAGSGAANVGVAPEAGIVALKVLDAAGRGRTSRVLAAIDWVLNYGKSYNVRVVNISLGHPVYESAKNDPLAIGVDKLMHDGFVVVVSAGNFGSSLSGQPLYGGITSPANAQGAIAVGAVNTQGSLARGDDRVTSFSSRGPTRFDRFSKPDLVAPGYAVTSLDAYGYLSATYPSLRLMAGYLRLSGTSMAAPAVSGAAALVLSANPRLSAHTVKAILQFTAQRLPATDVATQGAGLVNAAGAVRLAMLVRPEAGLGTVWLRSDRAPVTADLLFGETAHWGRAFIWADKLIPTNAIYVSLKQWRDDDAWGFKPDEIVRGYDALSFSGTSDHDEVVWGLTDDNIVWGYLDDNIVWGMNDNIVWGMDDNIVWSMDDNIVWSLFYDNVVWGMLDDNIVWGYFDDNVVWSMAVLTGEVR
jgi:serine protease AprX